jgi:translation initiation factor 2B subunit (eIF-2B alpha/beta/delta family)
MQKLKLNTFMLVVLVMSCSATSQSTKTVAENERTNSKCSEYAGKYENRTVTCENGILFIQRTVSQSEAQGQRFTAPKLKMIKEKDDHYMLERIPAAKIKFIRDTKGQIIEINVLNRSGQWETSKKDMSK